MLRTEEITLFAPRLQRRPCVFGWSSLHAGCVVCSLWGYRFTQRRHTRVCVCVCVCVCVSHTNNLSAQTRFCVASLSVRDACGVQCPKLCHHGDAPTTRSSAPSRVTWRRSLPSPPRKVSLPHCADGAGECPASTASEPPLFPAALLETLDQMRIVRTEVESSEAEQTDRPPLSGVCAARYHNSETNAQCTRLWALFGRCTF